MNRLVPLLVLLFVASTVFPVHAQTIAEPTTLIDNVLADLGGRIGRRLTRVNITYQYQFTRYPDASLGCPEPGKSYAQAATNGWQVTITPASGGGPFDYRALNETVFWLCVNGQGQAPLGQPAQQPVQPVAPQPTTPSIPVNTQPTTFQQPMAYVGPDGNVYLTSVGPNPGPVAVTNNAQLARVAGDPYLTGQRYFHLAWSPDGNSLLFVRADVDPFAQTETGAFILTSGRPPIQVARGFAGQFGSVWSPDGAEVAYAMFAGNTPGGIESVFQQYQIQAVPAAGGQARFAGSIRVECGGVGRITFEAADKYYAAEARLEGAGHDFLAWTPLGFAHTSRCNIPGTALTGFDGRQLWENKDLLPLALSPDRSRLIGSQAGQPVLVDVSSGAATPLLTQPNADQFGWSVDGSTIFYSTRSVTGSMTVPGSDAPKQLFPENANIQSYRVSLWRVPVTGGQSQEIAGHNGYAISGITFGQNVAAFTAIDSSLPMLQSAASAGRIGDALARWPRVQVGLLNNGGSPNLFAGSQPVISAAASFTAIPAPVNSRPTGFVCLNTPASRLEVGGQARVTPGEPNALNSKPTRPSKNPESKRVGSIPAGGVFTVLDGPWCADSFSWWLVNYNGIVGWTAEGQGAEYWLEPLAQG